MGHSIRRRQNDMASLRPLAYRCFSSYRRRVHVANNNTNNNNTSKYVVAAVVVTTVAALGASTVYLPFVADKDRIRGLDEQGELYQSEALEYQKALEQMKREAAQEREQQPTSNKSNSMWSRMKRDG